MFCKGCFDEVYTNESFEVMGQSSDINQLIEHAKYCEIHNFFIFCRDKSEHRYEILFCNHKNAAAAAESKT